MNDKELATMYAEVWEILKLQPKELVNKIPEYLLERIEHNRDKTNTFKYDFSKDLTEQNITVMTKSFLVTVYRLFIATPEDRAEIEAILEKGKKRQRLNQYADMLNEEDV